MHLRWDDPACFLRTWLNQYAVLINPGAWTFREHTAAHDVMDKPVEEASFLERFRHMLVTEEGDTLWLARATPRAWLEQGKKIAVKNAPTDFGTLGLRNRLRRAKRQDPGHGRNAVAQSAPGGAAAAASSQAKR